MDNHTLKKFVEKFGEETIFYVADIFTHSNEADDQNTYKLADKASAKFPEKKITYKDVYDCLRAATALGYMEFRPPIDEDLATKLAGKCGIDVNNVKVVRVQSDLGNYLSAEAAKVVFDLIVSRNPSPEQPVGLGLGAGEATRGVCRHLGDKLRDTGYKKILKLIGISSGSSPEKPEYSPASFFNLFPDFAIHSRVTLLSEPLLTAGEFKNRKSSMGLREGFKAKDAVDIVITSMGDFQHDHDGFHGLLKNAERHELLKKPWLGNVQYRPYTKDGPVQEENNEERVATLFEVEDFVARADPRSRKAVVLIVRPCSVPDCGMTKTRALIPLVVNMKLRVFSHLIIDSQTARELLQELP